MTVRTRWLGVALALAGGVGFAFAMQEPWWSIGEAQIGPFGTRSCFGGECRGTGLSWIGGSGLWLRSAVAARAAGFIAMFVLLALAAGLAARRVPDLVTRAAIVATLTAAVTGGCFLFMFPGIAGASIDVGIYLFIAAVGLGLGSALVVFRGSGRSPKPEARGPA